MEIARKRTIGGESEFLLTNRDGIAARRKEAPQKAGLDGFRRKE
jgi:hypothetical protein